jgi:hypothetical protein
LPGGFSAPHLGQWMTKGAPQSPQNFLPAGLSLPHLEQHIVPAFRLDEFVRKLVSSLIVSEPLRALVADVTIMLSSHSLSCCRCEPIFGRLVHVEGVGHFPDRLSLVYKPARQFHLLEVKLTRAPKVNASSPGCFPARSGTFPDKVPFKLSYTCEYGHDQLAGVIGLNLAKPEISAR